MAETKVNFLGTGRRKTSVARVILSGGEGNFVINKRALDEYFGGRGHLSRVVIQPFATTENLNKFDVRAKTTGGGLTGQAGALSLGIARALLKVNPELRPILSKAGLLRRDPRMVERKKYGRPGARKRFQFSKR